MDEQIRHDVYLKICKYPVENYKVTQRLILLERGLNDCSDSVQKVRSRRNSFFFLVFPTKFFCTFRVLPQIVRTTVIPQWLESYKNNCIAFLSDLKLDATNVEIDRFRAVAKLVLPEIFR